MQEEFYGDVDVFFCPAHSHIPSPDSASTTDYVGITGVGAAAAGLPLSDPHAGFFGYDRQITFKDIKDGTSNTIAVVEVLDGGPPGQQVDTQLFVGWRRMVALTSGMAVSLAHCTVRRRCRGQMA